jgi:hypothetical protein
LTSKRAASSIADTTRPQVANWLRFMSSLRESGFARIG